VTLAVEQAPDGDPIEGLVGFTAVLRGAGLQITTDRVAAFLSALDELDITSQWQTYWAGRLTLCADPDDLPANQAFEEWFAERRRGATLVDERKPPPARLAHPSTGQDGGDGETTHTIRARLAPRPAAPRDLADLTAAEREHLRKLLRCCPSPDAASRRRGPARRARPAAPARGPAQRRRGASLLRRDHSRRPAQDPCSW
jgi:uncharacterized protein with von Willebrand factor type A (vWA) domain